MKKMRKLRDRSLSIMAAAVIAVGASAQTVLPLAVINANAGQQLGQTDFDDGVGLPWHIVESSPAEMSFELADGVYRVEIISPGGRSRGGEDRWDCQFRHRGLKIVAGHQYEVSYEITASNAGKYYTKIGNLEGNIEIWHNNMSDNGPDFGGSWDCINIGANQTNKVSLKFTANQSMDVAEWAFHLGGDGEWTNGDCFPAGTVIEFDNMSLVDLTSDENDYPVTEPYQRRDILTNQVGYLEGRAKRATMLCSSKDSLDYDIKDSSGKVVYSGSTEFFGYDEDSGDMVHTIDFTDFDEPGEYTLEAENGAVSGTVIIGGTSVYSSLLYDSLNYFYQNRSGIEIESQYITSGDTKALARAAGHPKDTAEIEQTWGYSGSSGTIDVTGGWYDAGDHGKYVVNGGFSLWMMQNQYETALKYGFEDAYADGTMALPENSNKYPDLLDETRWEMEWMFSMIVDSGKYEGMLYHKAHDEKWTGLGIAPADDDMKRIVKPPTTAATLNFVACAAQAARLWKGIDDDFADKCLDAAKSSYKAAKDHPDMYAPLDESQGGGAYGDDFVEDEFYWAAMELYITTGDDDYYDDAKDSDFFLKMPTELSGGEAVGAYGSFDWGHVAALGTLSAALNSDQFSKDDAGDISKSITAAADKYVSKEADQGYGLPYAQSQIGYNNTDTGYIWGSNSVVADNAIVIAYAYLLTDEDKYLDGAIGGMDYLLGRNAMDYSYVTGYGTHSIEYPHHRYWAYLINEEFPKAPCGVMCGGPNSGMEDPWVKGSGWKPGEIAPQKCYMDHIEAWSVNECTINWNASLAWLTAFTAQEAGGIEIGSTGSSSGITNDGGDAESNTKPVYDDSEADPTVTKAPSADKDSSEPTTAAAAKAAAEEKKSNVGVIALIAGACVVGLVSIEIFVYKLIKMKNANK